MAKGRIFRCYCEFFIKAKNEKEVERYLQGEDNFVEKHLLIADDSIAGNIIDRVKNELEQDYPKRELEVDLIE